MSLHLHIWRHGSLSKNSLFCQRVGYRGRWTSVMSAEKHESQVSFQYSINFFHISNSGAGGLDPIPAAIGREARYTLDRWAVWLRANTERQTTIPSSGQFRITYEANLTNCMSLDCGWEPEHLSAAVWGWSLRVHRTRLPQTDLNMEAVLPKEEGLKRRSAEFMLSIVDYQQTDSCRNKEKSDCSLRYFAA